MANIRASLERWKPVPNGNVASYSWRTWWVCWPADASKEFFDLEIEVAVNDGDSAAVIKTKIIAALDARINERRAGDIVQIIQALDFSRWR